MGLKTLFKREYLPKIMVKEVRKMRENRKNHCYLGIRRIIIYKGFPVLVTAKEHWL
jgi:hypothetical protein